MSWCFTHLLQKLGSRWPFLVQDVPWELALQFHQIVVLGVLNEVLILITFWLQAMDEALDKTAQQDKKKELKYLIISKIFTKNLSILILLMVSSFIKCNRTKILKNLNIKQIDYTVYSMFKLIFCLKFSCLSWDLWIFLLSCFHVQLTCIDSRLFYSTFLEKI